MNKKLILGLCIAGMLGITACGSQQTSEQSESTVEAATEKEEALNNAKDTVEANLAAEENADPEIFYDGSEIAPSIDISGCDTFTQIVDKKLSSGMCYTNATIGDADVLLVGSGCYDNMDGNMAAIDSTIFIYDKDGLIKEIGKVTSGGTAYPLAIKDGNLFCASNGWISEVTISNEEIQLVKESWADYSSKDNGEDAFYTYDAATKTKTEIDEDSFWALYDVLEDAEILNFDKIQ